MRIKVCGNTQLNQVYELDEIGVQYAGFIFYPKSPRYVADHIKGGILKKAKVALEKVGVFVNAGYDTVMHLVDDYGLQMVQLHGDESPELCERISTQVQTIKVFRVKEEDDIAGRIKEYNDLSGFFLFDRDDQRYGGSGRQFDWQVLDKGSVNRPFFLSGGIGMEDMDEVKRFASGDSGKYLYAVDVNSRFESKPGVKDMEKVRSLAAALR